MLMVLAKAKLGEGALDAGRAAMETMINASRAEPGCISYAYAVDVLDPGMLHIVEKWDDEAALASHFAEPHMAEFRAALAEVGPQDLKVRMYEADPEPMPL